MVVAKGAAEAHPVGFALDFVLFAVVYALDDLGERVFESGEVVYGLLEESVCVR